MLSVSEGHEVTGERCRYGPVVPWSVRLSRCPGQWSAASGRALQHGSALARGRMTILAKARRIQTPRPAGGLLIVARDQPELYRNLQRAYRDTDEIVVLLDRRRGERRRAIHPVVGERRHRDRRSLPPITPDLRVQQYVLVYPTGAGALAPPSTGPRWPARVVRYLCDRWERLSGTTPDQ